jgi:DNA-binding transcriptional LysR family regulator
MRKRTPMQKVFSSMDTMSWDDLRILLAVHRGGSLLAAGKLLGLSTSTTGRRLDALEAAAGYRLVSRSQMGTQVEPRAMRLIRLSEEFEHGLGAERRDGRADIVAIKVSVPDGWCKKLHKL